MVLLLGIIVSGPIKCECNIVAISWCIDTSYLNAAICVNLSTDTILYSKNRSCKHLHEIGQFFKQLSRGDLELVARQQVHPS